MKLIKAVIQARMGSTRLPNKSLIDFNEKPMFQIIIDRIRLAKKKNCAVLLATSENKEDDKLAEFAAKIGIETVRGDSENVLSRFLIAEKNFPSDWTLRFTGDNPLIAFDFLEDFIDFTVSNNLDYSAIKGLPTGMGYEIYKSNKLKELCNENLEWFCKEHVTPYFYRNPNIYKIKYFEINSFNSNSISDFRLTIDTLEDYKVALKIHGDLISKLKREPLTAEIIKYCENNPELLKLNSKVHQRKYDVKYV